MQWFGHRDKSRSGIRVFRRDAHLAKSTNVDNSGLGVKGEGQNRVLRILDRLKAGSGRK